MRTSFVQKRQFPSCHPSQFEAHWLSCLNFLGLIYDNRTQLWHLFAQYNPYDEVSGSQSWLHATSSDLFDWQQLPIAILDSDDVAIWSGTAVFDYNSSGLCVAPVLPCMICVWAGSGLGKETINLASSIDSDFVQFRKYVKNPVIDIGSANFRDPATFWFDAARSTRTSMPADLEAQSKGYWVAVIAHSDQSKVEIWKSSNLTVWSKASEFSPSGVGGTWECPDLFPMQLKNGSTYWVLSVSIGGTPGFYFIGEFDGILFSASTDHTLIDYGLDYYASITYNEAPDSRRVQIGWFVNLNYAGAIPTSPWRGSHTLPRELTLREHVEPNGQSRLFVHTVPVKELYRYQQQRYVLKNPVLLTQDFGRSIIRDLIGFPGAPTYLVNAQLNSTCISPPCSFTFHIRQDSNTGQSMKIGLIVPANGQSFVPFMDRSDSGYQQLDDPWNPTHMPTLPAVNSTCDRSSVIDFRFVVDRTSVEIFLQDGLISLSYLFFPNPFELNWPLEMQVTQGEFTLQRMEIVTLRGAEIRDTVHQE